MNYPRAIVAGFIAWLCVVITFYVLEHIPFFKESATVQAFIAAFTIIFYAWFAAWFYYKKAVKKSGLLEGIVITGTPLILDVLVTIPLIEIPKGSSYEAFFSNPLLWILAVLNVLTVFVYFKSPPCQAKTNMPHFYTHPVCDKQIGFFYGMPRRKSGSGYSLNFLFRFSSQKDTAAIPHAAIVSIRNFHVIRYDIFPEMSFRKQIFKTEFSYIYFSLKSKK
ncbi:DUF5367 family protein [Flavobacterium chungangense]|uniref:Uncharacterized protein n=1 Tax=Flavobacterium chungangense TaxID=554283 RepID=A0A6V6YXK7_9FLAO|nr:DUF5367 family protein [Flavobacterium chungangense]CAD0004165.1 hypothetical protein FLACHUCJ7_01774 [Flavobacterium chungangense]